ncbi:response regulator transcription factor [Pseudonocardia aurantiaca]|uniref:LuxR C-terminal-related transcriptional regulator n=1 Tax=Pseudonocardia aurantiaca TaxID=75290 RepID=A0ABW4FG31_9PSEU
MDRSVAAARPRARRPSGNGKRRRGSSRSGCASHGSCTTCSFLVKDTAHDELRRAVRLVAAGDAMLSPAVTRRVMRGAAAGRPALATDRLAGLTEREREVLAEVGAGRSNAEIGERLFISPATARTHVSRLLGKLGVRDRSQLVVLAYETGLVMPGAGL